MDCPICGFRVADARGLAAHFRHQAATHPSYTEWSVDQKWAGLVEGQDYVSCLECGYRSKALQGHLQKHGLDAGSYRLKHGEAARVRAVGSEAKRGTALRGALVSSPRSGHTKVLPCLSCRQEHEVSAYTATSTCDACKAKQEEARWDGKSEPLDYVTCLECGVRAENLTSHFQNTHPGYRDRHPGALVVALRSSVRDKTALRGQVLSDETRGKMSDGAGRWNKGLTKANHPSLARQAMKMRGKVPWSKGKTVKEDVRLAITVAKLKLYVGENRPWHNGLRADLTVEDFKPFMDPVGRIDRKAIVKATGLSWRTIFTYMKSFTLGTSDVHVKARAERQIIRMDKAVLLRSLLGNGKACVARIQRDTGRNPTVIKRECARHGLAMYTLTGEQTLCMDVISDVLGGLSYDSEWMSRRFVNPVSGHMFKFDGYFKDVGLVVEYHGHQHYMFPNGFHRRPEHRARWEAMLERDRVKRKLLQEAPDLTYLEIRYDDTWRSHEYMRGLLRGLGVLR